MKKLLESELNNPVLCVKGRLFTLKEVVEERKAEKAEKAKTEKFSPIPAIVERIKKGETLKDILTEDDIYRLCIERYKISLKKPNSSAIRIHTLAGSFSLEEVIEHLEKRTETSKKFADAMCKYLEWLIRRA